MQRREFIALTTLLFFSAPLRAGGKVTALRIGLTPTLLHERHTLLAQWKAYLESRLAMPVTFVLRDSYRDTMDLIKQQRLDVAWLSDYPYVLMKPWVRLLVTPLKEGRPYYRSYLIVPAHDKHTRSIADLHGKIFAYADPYSHTGYLYPRHTLLTQGKSPKTFFGRTFFTWSHRKAIEAVAQQLADGAAVESYVWDALARDEPQLTAATRIVNRSQEFGFPPLVTVNSLSEKTTSTLRRVLMEMTLDAEGRQILAKLHLEGFVPGDSRLYTEVELIAHAAGQKNDTPRF
jgi:phosphonate transport system substrate-binding protein